MDVGRRSPEGVRQLLYDSRAFRCTRMVNARSFLVSILLATNRSTWLSLNSKHFAAAFHDEEGFALAPAFQSRSTYSEKLIRSIEEQILGIWQLTTGGSSSSPAASVGVSSDTIYEFKTDHSYTWIRGSSGSVTTFALPLQSIESTNIFVSSIKEAGIFLLSAPNEMLRISDDHFIDNLNIMVSEGTLVLATRKYTTEFRRIS
jgi:hypothetical protein